MAQRQSPGVPQLLRVLNDRAALNLLFTEGPQTRAQMAAATSLSKVTASQMVERLESRGLIEAVGTRPGNRGPNAQVYAVVGSYAHVVGVNVGPETIVAACADLTGEVRGRVELALTDGDEPVSVVHRAVAAAAADAGTTLDGVNRVMLATPGIIDPGSGDIGFAWDLPSWHRGLHEALEKDLGTPVVIENDVNLAAVAEHREGAARGVDDFVYVWFSRGLGVGVVLGGKLHRGANGGAGEIGYLPVPGVSLPEEPVTRRAKGSFQRLAGGEVVEELGRSHGFSGEPHEIVAAAVASPDGVAFLDEIADRMALGVASVCSVLDPALVVLGGEVGYAGGTALADRVAAALPRIAPLEPRVVVGTAAVEPVLRGAMRVALDTVRDEIFSEE
ncbi:putative NBD/HSP70 family sugar kinase [Stackebrandtia albiflava]|uniref:Putative NBD/HSP70 family sugar kinase n=1 Tax=Stackebrandtia albiflava TaxID=406432 RepID=A0A562V9U9_9ACTN|nr:ROK family transcriptional regulator [Stackebrandtia albiflava]TWJ14633.1 putative NBD/HSP70 family sugar kinase [Stackebrandtia albiflava]